MVNLQQNKKVLLLFGILTSIMFIIVMFIVNPIIDGGSGVDLLRLQLAFKTELGQEIVSSWNENGKQNFLKYIYTDYIYAFSYAFFLASLYLHKLLKNKVSITRKHNMILILPFVAGLFDMMENTIEVFFIKNPQNFPEILFFFHSVLAAIKWAGLPLLLYFLIKPTPRSVLSI